MQKLLRRSQLLSSGDEGVQVWVLLDGVHDIRAVCDIAEHYWRAENDDEVGQPIGRGR